MSRSTTKTAETLSDIVTTRLSTPVDVRGVKTVSLESVTTVRFPSAKNFDAADVEQSGDNTVDIDATDFVTGLKGQVSTTGFLPTGLSGSTDYFIIKDDDTFVRFATSLGNALAGTAVTITAIGVGTHTFTPTSLAGGSVIHERTNADQAEIDAGSATWASIDSASSISGSSPPRWYTQVDPESTYIRAR